MNNIETYDALKSVLDTGETRGPEDFMFLATENYIKPITKDGKVVWGLTKRGEKAYMELDRLHDWLYHGN